jgi:hypothetical protein
LQSLYFEYFIAKSDGAHPETAGRMQKYEGMNDNNLATNAVRPFPWEHFFTQITGKMQGRLHLLSIPNTVFGKGY